MDSQCGPVSPYVLDSLRYDATGSTQVPEMGPQLLKVLRASARQLAGGPALAAQPGPAGLGPLLGRRSRPGFARQQAGAAAGAATGAAGRRPRERGR